LQIVNCSDIFLFFTNTSELLYQQLSKTIDDDISFNWINSTKYLNTVITLTDENINNITITQYFYRIILIFVCACVSLLTIFGNLLVLITFRRIKTVSEF
ncbi:unnamed protein product, partial [Didymodactylos carnosus]